MQSLYIYIFSLCIFLSLYSKAYLFLNVNFTFPSAALLHYVNAVAFSKSFQQHSMIKI